MLVDSHAHLNFPELLADIDGVLVRAKEAGVEKIINIGTSLADSRLAIELAQKYPGIWATVGIHPNDDPMATVDSVDWEEFARLARQPKVVAIGETGLDFSRSQDKERQVKLFEKQIEIAEQLDLPLSIHVRDGWEEIKNIDLSKSRGVFHCYSGPAEFLPNFYISFAGNVTFKNAAGLRELAAAVPLDRLLVETDCPFLSPEPLRGSRNEPANVKIVASVLAEVKKVSLAELANQTSANAVKLFGTQ